MTNDNKKSVILDIMLTNEEDCGYKYISRNLLSRFYMMTVKTTSFPDAALAELVSDGMVEKFGENKYRVVK